MITKRLPSIYLSIQLVILAVSTSFTITTNAAVNPPLSTKTITDLLRGSMTFTQKIEKFSYSYNATYPQYKIPTYIQHKELTKNNAIYFSSKINNTLYSSVIADSKTGRVTSLQLTYVAPQINTVDQPTSPTSQTGADSSQATQDPSTANNSHVINNNVIAIDYMAALFQWFNPTKSPDYCQKEITRLLKVGRDEPLYEEIINNLRYVIVDHGEKGITLAVEPIKLATVS